MAFRFVHTADVHLDSPLQSLALRDAELAALIATATRETFAAIIDLCIEEAVDALLIAGDLYDGDATSMKTAAFLAGQLRRLPPEITVFLLKGNHDAQSDITKRLDLPANVKQFTGYGEIHDLISRDGDAVAVHGVSFAGRHIKESLLPKYKPATAGAINVGLMHTSLDGSPDHDPYAPVAASDLGAHGFDYWALGHIHKRMELDRGGARIVMPGIPQGRHVNEGGPRSVTLASIAAGGAVATEERFLALAEFMRLDISVDACAGLEDLRTCLEPSFAKARAEAKARQSILRPRLIGTTPAAWSFRRDRALLLETARDIVQGHADLWIETLELEIAAPTASPDGAGPTLELGDDMTAALASPAFADDAAKIVDELRRFLPREASDSLGHDDASAAAFLQRMMREAADDALARLAGDGGDSGDRA